MLINLYNYFHIIYFINKINIKKYKIIIQK